MESVKSIIRATVSRFLSCLPTISISLLAAFLLFSSQPFATFSNPSFPYDSEIALMDVPSNIESAALERFHFSSTDNSIGLSSFLSIHQFGSPSWAHHLRDIFKTFSKDRIFLGKKFSHIS